ncbi:MAG: CvpA family protein [Alphaproteobacteria bacterium]|nr:CvpA family protein [Alphaproteobacteria bacterium]
MMELTLLDYAFVLTVFMSAVLGYGGGFVAGLLGIVSWIASGFTAKIISPMIEPYLLDALGGNHMLASMAAYVVVFIVVVMLLSALSKHFSHYLHNTALEDIDKSLGFLFGILRGIFLMAVAYICILWVMPDRHARPEWVEKAKSAPLLRSGSLFVSMLLPDSDSFRSVHELIVDNMIGEKDGFERLARPTVEGGGGKSADESGYKDAERRELEQQIQRLDRLLEE